MVPKYRSLCCQHVLGPLFGGHIPSSFWNNCNICYFGTQGFLAFCHDEAYLFVFPLQNVDLDKHISPRRSESNPPPFFSETEPRSPPSRLCTVTKLGRKVVPKKISVVPKSYRSEGQQRSTTGGAGSPSHNALRINYIINRRLSRDLLVVSGVHGVKPLSLESLWLK